MHTLRTRFSKDILTEFLPPKKDLGKVVVLLGGLPSTPSKFSLMNFLHEKNYWSFFPRYRGTWESGGEFLKSSPVRDVADVLSGLQKSFTDLWAKKGYSVKVKEIIVVGSSFGGAVAIDLLADKTWGKRVSKVVAFSPVIDWRVFPKEDFAKEEEFLRLGYGPVYRYKKSGIIKLWQGKFCNPASHEKDSDGSKLLIIQAKDDDSVPWKYSVDFAKRVQAKYLLVNKGGHFSVSEFMNPKFYRKIKLFLKK